MLSLKGKLSLLLLVLVLFSGRSISAQSVASGTIQGTVIDPTDAVVSGAKVDIRNPITGYQGTTTTDSAGTFRFSNLPFNNYHLEITQSGFAVSSQDAIVRTTVPVAVKVVLLVAGGEQSISVEASGSDLLESVPYAHADVDSSVLDKLPAFSPGSGLSDAIVLSSPGVVADSNGFFHPLGDHAQTSFSIDGQPVSDQQSKAFSTQIPVNAVQSMELVTGTPDAQYGDKTSLVVNATTRSGMGLTAPTGGFAASYGSFGTVSGEGTLGFGSKKAGYFLAANGTRSGRFLDTPEFAPIHAIGNNSSAFNRADFNPTAKDTLHFNVFVARNWFQIPNTYDQLSQDQRQKIVTLNVAPGYQHTFNAHSLLTVSPFIRQDRVHFYASGDPFDDSPATAGQERHLTNYGVKADISYSTRKQNVKVGTQLMQTRLHESFNLGITDPLFNPVCLNKASGDPVELPAVKNSASCAGLGFSANPDLQPGLVPFDLTRGGSLFQFAGKGNVDEYSFYIQDSVTVGGLTLNPGFRMDRYQGPSAKSLAEPRMGISYLIGPTGTVLRAGYARTMETPYNENLLLSSFTGPAGLTDFAGAAAAAPLQPGTRNQYNVGLQQAFGKYLRADADYFWKFTNNAYDFGVLLNTPITFPISWQKSKLDGVSFRLNTTDIHGFQATTTIGHTRARYFAPENGGLLFDSPLNTAVFRIDHDQAFQQTTNLRYQWRKNGPWADFTWRYDSGLVAGAVGSVDDLLALTAAQQAAVGFSCGNEQASVDHRIEDCSPSGFTTTRVKVPADGTEDDDHNPPRIASRHIFDVGVGTDNLFKNEGKTRATLRVSISNLTNKAALYNFLSTFSGTHFLAPRTYQASLGFAF